jgi:hypothetical protein
MASRKRRTETGQVPIRNVPIGSIRPAAENDTVYRPVDPTDPAIVALAENIATHGVLEPLAITTDGVILSGHRRFCAANVAGVETVPVRVEQIQSTDPRFLPLLVSYNHQRQKSIDELLRESIVDSSVGDAYEELQSERIKRSRDATETAETMELGARRRRSEISPAKRPMLDAVRQIVGELREFWPLSVRTIHYQLLNVSPLTHASKPNSRYRNTKAFYKQACDLCARARLEGFLPFDAIDDPTRPVTNWRVHRGPGDYIREQIDGFLGGYSRDLLQSQPNHVEVVAEKMTLRPILKPVCMRFTVRLTIGRGFCSIPPRQQLLERFRESGKSRLALVFVSDHDPDGEVISESFARSMRDDFGIAGSDIVAVRAALTADQVNDLRLPPNHDRAKPGSANYPAFVRQFGDKVHELEAVPPEQLQRLLTDALEAVIDAEMFNAEVEAEKRDAEEIRAARRRIMAAI